MSLNKLVAVADVGSKKIDTYVGTKTKGGIFDIKSSFGVPYSGFENGVFKDDAKLRYAAAESVRRARKQAHCSINKVYVGVPGEFCVVRTCEIERTFPYPKTVTAEEIDAILEQGDTFNGEDGCVTITQTVLYATVDDTRRVSNPEGEFASKLKIFASYILCDKDFIIKFDDIMSSLDIRETVYVNAEYAEAMNLFDEEERKKNLLFADLGYNTSSVAIVRGDSLIDLASFSMGGSAFTEDLTRILQISEKEALHILGQVNLNMATDGDIYELNAEEGYPATVINEILLARIDDFAAMLTQAIDRFSFQCPILLPLYLTGGGFKTVKGAKDKLAEALGRKIEYITSSVPGFNTPDKSTAVGLIDEAIRTEKSKENILSKIRSKLGGH